MKEYPQQFGCSIEELVGSIDHLKRRVSRGFPVIVLQRFSFQNPYGHYRVVVGYDDETQKFTTLDPAIGRNYNISYTEFAALWTSGSTFTLTNWTLVVLPKWIKMEEYLLLVGQQTPSPDGQLSPESAYLIVSTIALVVGAIGGIPQIIRFVKPKPQLRISDTIIEGLPEKRIRIVFNLENKEKRWRKNADATNVIAEYFVMDKNHEQWGGVHNVVLSPYLPAGVKLPKQLAHSHSFEPTGNPYTVVLLIRCDEGVARKEKLAYVYGEV